MLSRLVHDEAPMNLPQKWKEDVEELLQKSYGENLSETSKTFEVFGYSFPKEVLVMVCLVDANNSIDITPVSYFASADLDEKNDPKKVMDTLVDSVGVFYDDYFATKDWDDYTNNWDAMEMNGVKFFYKSTRENVALTLQADALLNQ